MSYSDFHLANFWRQPSPRVLEQVSDPRFGTSKLIQDGLQFFQFIPCSSYVVDARCGTSKVVQDGLQFFQLIPRSSYDNNGRIHSAEESKVPVKNEMYYSDFSWLISGNLLLLF